MIIRFNVFGRQMSVHQKDQQWLLFNESDTGMSSRVYDVVIPADLTRDDLAGYLDDIYHEYATDKYPEVVELV
ncbi:hypothetical protein SG34_005250 [Thalassomonas viridans]|uniref:DUF7661 domain-containing protein n=1 Tax=Thalassomonas viridans TaxID=137584 RepID=A0AAF0CAB2_9GAMM|nr:hypothetical protein [Thalassomonas viridans]WDE06331.1 hypothetical protein SG34_005250 [Thalassomonas viridans]